MRSFNGKSFTPSSSKSAISFFASEPLGDKITENTSGSISTNVPGVTLPLLGRAQFAIILCSACWPLMSRPRRESERQ